LTGSSTCFARKDVGAITQINALFDPLDLVSHKSRGKRHDDSMNFVPPELEEILRQTPALQRAYLVGGCVRDALAGFPQGKDFDVEVFRP
jgi:hypothetical protein